MARWGSIVLLTLTPAGWAGEPLDLVRCVRGSTSIADALGRLDGLFSAGDHASVLFVFEQEDFGQREVGSGEVDYHAQLADWVAAIREKAGDRRVRLALTGSSKPFAPTAGDAFLRDARRASPVPARRWLQRLARFPKGKHGAVVYISGSPREGFGEREWDPEEVAASLNRSGTRLYVVMPEARFFDFLPTREFVGAPDDWWLVPFALTSEWRFDAHWASVGTDCPSAFGDAAYMRAAAATGGAYLFYPRKRTDWLDACPCNIGLMAEMLPRLPAPAEAAAAAAADPVLREIAESTRRCAPCAGFDRYVTFDLGKAAKFVPLAAPAREHAELCAAEALRLTGVLRSVEAGECKGASRRSLAQLRFSVFVLESCAFHFASWADAAERAQAFEVEGKGREFYERRGLGINLAGWERIELRRLLPPFPDVPPGQLDDVLGRAVRAKVAELPPDLRSRAARVVAAAEAVLAHEALSPWGWMVYYSALASFEPVWTGELRGEYTRDDPSSEAAKTKTKREDPPPEPAAPGSGGGGPTTGGG